MTNKRPVVLGVVSALALGLGLGVAVHTAHAQRLGRGRNRVPGDSSILASVTSLTCSFPASAAASWENSEPQIVVKRTGVFTLTINEIDTQDGTAHVTGLGDPAHVTVKLAGANLHFLDMRLSGALAITTVFAEESHDGRLKAVHSRSDYLGRSTQGVGGPPSVSQYYGDCEIGSR
jgi:hypothetical protein